MLFPFFFNDTATTEIYTLSLHDALPISSAPPDESGGDRSPQACSLRETDGAQPRRSARHGETGREQRRGDDGQRSEEHTSELQSRQYLVCRLLLEKKKITTITQMPSSAL